MSLREVVLLVIKFSNSIKKAFYQTRSSLLICLILTGALVLSYSNSFHGPFIFDGIGSIKENSSIRSLGESLILSSYQGATSLGRPLLNFSFALNYLIGGLSVEGYHLTNLGIHILATLVLFGFLQGTLQLPSFSAAIRRDSSWLAGSISMLWSLHPLQTESVTYIVQRAESLMGLFYLLTLYTFFCSQRSLKPWWWLLLSVVFCYCGMATKEIMVTAPWIVLLYDWIFIERNFQNLWRSRRFYYLSLFSSWILAAFLIVSSKRHGDSIGFFGEISVRDYAQTQAWALLHYLKLVFWPDPLIFDYGILKITSLEKVLPEICGIFFTAVGIVWMLCRSPHWGFWGLWGAFVLAPTCSFLPIHAQTIVEHRVYLALAPFLFYVVLVSYGIAGKRIFPVIILLGMALGLRTYQRNEDYQSEESIWEATVLNAPLNPRARNNYAGILYDKKKWKEAETYLQETIRIIPDYIPSYHNCAVLYQEQGRHQDAEQMYRKAIGINAFVATSWYRLGAVLVEQDKVSEALEVYQRGLDIDPKNTIECGNLANLYFIQGRIDKAMELYRKVIIESPKEGAAYLNLGGILESRGQWTEAEAVYLEALQNDLSHPEILERLQKIQQKLPSP